MACDPEVLKQIPLFASLDGDELAVLGNEVEIRNFVPGERIFKVGDPGGPAYVVVSGPVRLTTADEDHQEVIVDEPHAMLAAVQAPVIMMSQNRQDAKDRLRSELDFEVNRRAASDIQGLAPKLNSIDDKMEDLLETIRRDARDIGPRWAHKT